MNVNKIQYQTVNFKSEKEKKQKFTDKFSSGIKNTADINDCVAVPRSVFKGYLAFMLGTAALTLGSFIPEKCGKLKKGTLITGNLVNLFGIWSFVRPYIIKDATPTVNSKLETLDTAV